MEPTGFVHVQENAAPPAGGGASVTSRAVKLAIGAGAGLCLSLVKLLEVNFYIGQPSPVITGGILTVLVFTVVAGLFTAFGTDEQDCGKLFMQGLLAPSLMIALVHRGADAPSANPGDASVPTLGSVLEHLSPTLYAAEQASASPVLTLKANQFDGSAIDGALMLLGRAPAQSSFVYVVGKSTSQQQATTTATKVSQAMRQAGVPDAVHVAKADTGHDFYVTIGSFQTAAAATGNKRQILSKVSATHTVDPSALALLINGPIVDARALTP